MRKFKFRSRVTLRAGGRRRRVSGGLRVVASGSVVADAAKRPAVVRAFSPPTQTAMAKTFFRGGPDFMETDQGNHFGKIRRDNASSQDAMIDNRNFDRFFARTPLTLLHFSMPDFDTWYAKVLQRAKAYKFTMATQCAGVRRGQRAGRSRAQRRRARPSARTGAPTSRRHRGAQQQAARAGAQGGLGSLADVRCVGRDNNNNPSSARRRSRRHRRALGSSFFRFVPARTGGVRRVRHGEPTKTTPSGAPVCRYRRVDCVK